MPRACLVECHAGRYTELQVTILDATGLSRGDKYVECQVVVS